MKLIRNIIRIFYIYLFSKWACIPIWRSKPLQQYFRKAIESYVNENDEYKEARNNGLFYTVDDLEKVNLFAEGYIPNPSMWKYEEEMDEDVKILSNLLEKSRVPILTATAWMLRQPIAPNGSWYSGMDKIYFFAAYMFARKYGASPDQAVHYAHKWSAFRPAYFSAPITRGIRGCGIGQLLDIIYHSIPRFLEVIITRPWEIIGAILSIFVFIIIVFCSLPYSFVLNGKGK